MRGNIQHCEERGKRYAGSKPDILSHRVEEPDKINESLHTRAIGLIEHTIFEVAQQ